MNQYRILVVDDEENIRRLMQRIFKSPALDCEVVSAADGLAALGQIQQNFFELVVTDYEMPGLDGLELAQMIRRFSPETRVVLMSGSQVSLLRRAVEEYGLDGYLTKPFSPAEVVQVVHETLLAPLKIGLR